MRRTAPLILGAGPAGCAAAIVLAQARAEPVLVDRDADVGDALCGGFLSWRTAERLHRLGLDPLSLGAQPVERLRVFGKGRAAEIMLPKRAFGLSRRALDKALRQRAADAGAQWVSDTIRRVDGLNVVGRSREWHPDSLFLATGKHDLRGTARPRREKDPALGMRVRLNPARRLTRLLENTIELHLFDGGYAGVVLHEDGSTNVCLAVRKSLIAEAGADPHELLITLAHAHPHFALRLEPGWREARADTIGSVPYGWIARDTERGVFRLGDQAAVVPSLAGEGIDLALASGIAAAEAWSRGGQAAAQGYQRAFHARARRPLMWAGATWRLAERPAIAEWGLAAARLAPAWVRRLADATRLD